MFASDYVPDYVIRAYTYLFGVFFIYTFNICIQLPYILRIIIIRTNTGIYVLYV